MRKILIMISMYSFVLLLISCKHQSINQSSKFELRYQDDFESGLGEFWKKEIANDSRVQIVSDPLDINNTVLKINLSPDNIAANGIYSKGHRSEIKIHPKDSLNSITKYSFKFMVTDSFIKKGEPRGWIMIHQWHDYPPVGQKWGYARTNPPYNLYIQHNSNGVYYLKFSGGIRVNKVDNRSTLTYSEKLIPNFWYVFENEIKWHIYDGKAYCIPKLNGKAFSGKKDVKIYNARNMYNAKPNYFKMGLYQGGVEKYERSIYFDDFLLESRSSAYN